MIERRFKFQQIDLEEKQRRELSIKDTGLVDASQVPTGGCGPLYVYES